MNPPAPLIDVLIARNGAAWRMYSGPRSWRTPFSLYADSRGDVCPVGKPDIEDLDRFMWETDSPFERRSTGDGGLEILAKGRSAVTLVVWLRHLIELGRGLQADQA